MFWKLDICNAHFRSMFYLTFIDLKEIRETGFRREVTYIVCVVRRGA